MFIINSVFLFCNCVFGILIKKNITVCLGLIYCLVQFVCCLFQFLFISI